MEIRVTQTDMIHDMNALYRNVVVRERDSHHEMQLRPTLTLRLFTKEGTKNL